MKNIYLLLSMILMAGTLAAQRSSLAIGVEADAMAAVTNGSPFQMGAGSYIGLWLSKKIDHVTEVSLSLGHRHVGGHQRVGVVVDQYFYPTEYREVMTTSSLENLNHLQCNFNWTRRFGSDSPWSYSFGGYLGWLTAVEGGSVSLSWTASQQIVYFQDGDSAQDFRVFTAAGDFEDFRLAEFTRLDFGLTAGVRYQLTPGLSLQAQLTQGLHNQLRKSPVGGQQRHYLTALSIGFSAKIN